jgi:hypothetical protein
MGHTEKEWLFFNRLSQPSTFLENRVKNRLSCVENRVSCVRKAGFVAKKWTFMGRKTDFRGPKTDFRGSEIRPFLHLYIFTSAQRGCV